MNTSIRAVSLTLRELVLEHLKTDINLRAFFDPAHGGTMLVSLLAPEELAEQHEGVSLWLYRIERDEQTLNYPAQRSSRDHMVHEPLPLRLHYLVVSVVDVTKRLDGPELEQHVVGAVMQAPRATRPRSDVADVGGARTARRCRHADLWRRHLRGGCVTCRTDSVGFWSYRTGPDNPPVAADRLRAVVRWTVVDEITATGPNLDYAIKTDALGLVARIARDGKIGGKSR